MIRNSIILIFIFSCFFCASVFGQKDDVGLSKEEILKKINELSPKDSDYDFQAPEGWSQNLLSDASITYVYEGENIDSVKKIIDGIPSTTWKSKNYQPNLEIIIDLKSKKQFDRLVFYNLYSEMRGTAGGNNSTKNLNIYAANSLDDNAFELLDELTLTGPRGVCFKAKGGGQMCTFINNKEPDVIELKQTNARYIKLSLQSAYWGEAAREDWKSSYSLSEVMLFQAGT